MTHVDVHLTGLTSQVAPEWRSFGPRWWPFRTLPELSLSFLTLLVVLVPVAIHT